MTKAELKTKLENTRLFTDHEIENILLTVGTFSLGFVHFACDILGIELSQNDIDTIMNA